MSARNKSVITLILFVFTIGVNYAGATGWINGLSQSDVSKMYPTLITPAPFAFSIWGLIYLLLAASILWMLIRADRREVAEIVHDISPAFWASLVFNMLWIVTFSYVWIALSAVMIVAILLSLTSICKTLVQGPGARKPLLIITFGLYTGWLVIATIVNISALLVKLNWDGFGIAPETWPAVILAIALLIAFYIAAQLKNAILPLPIAWAYFAIYSDHSGSGQFSGKYPAVQITALVGVVVLLAMSALVYLKWGRSKGRVL